MRTKLTDLVTQLDSFKKKKTRRVELKAWACFCGSFDVIFTSGFSLNLVRFWILILGLRKKWGWKILLRPEFFFYWKRKDLLGVLESIYYRTRIFCVLELGKLFQTVCQKKWMQKDCFRADVSFNKNCESWIVLRFWSFENYVLCECVSFVFQ